MLKEKKQNVTPEAIEQAAEWLNFTVEEMESVLPYLLRHKPDISTAEEIEEEWNGYWCRNYDFDKDIVDYEFQYIGDYTHGGVEGTGISTKEKLKQYILDTYVYTLEDSKVSNGWCIYQVTDSSWIEKQ